MKKPLIVSRDHDGSLARDYGLCIDIEDSDGKYIGSTQRYEDALEIVRCVNAHEALVESLRECAPVEFCECGAIGNGNELDCVSCRAQKALALAKETT